MSRLISSVYDFGSRFQFTDKEPPLDQLPQAPRMRPGVRYVPHHGNFRLDPMPATGRVVVTAQKIRGGRVEITLYAS